MLIEQGLYAALDELDAMPKTHETMTLRQQAESYARIVRQWSMIPPSIEQRNAMLDLVVNLQADVAILVR